MKKNIHLLIVAAALSLAACTKVKNQSMTVVKDCTGTYLRLDNKDYHVCNTDKTSSYSDGAKVKASFKKSADCDGPEKDRIVCQMNHPNEGWVVIDHIK